MPVNPDPLAHLSSGEWRLRPRFQAKDPFTLAEEQAADEYLEEKWRQIYRFAQPWPADIKDKVHTLYKNHVKPVDGAMGCMQAAYQCLETIHPSKPKHGDAGRESLRERVYDVSQKDKRFNSVDLMMDVLQRDGQAGEPLTIVFDRKAKDWYPPVEAELGKMFDFKQEGVYFFGVSVAKGNHTVLLAVDNTPQTDGKPHPRIFWLDQHSGGLTKDVTGTLGTELGRTWKDPALPNRIWPLRPEQISRNP